MNGQNDFFSFAELTRTAQKIENVPNWEQIQNLQQLRIFLNYVRKNFGKPIRVNSAFRSPALNEMVGGSKTSAHLQGLAADICSASGTEADNRLLLKILEYQLPNIDQLISYHKVAGNRQSPIRFIHVGLSHFPGGIIRSQRLYK